MSKIEVHHSLVVARNVVKALEKILPKEIAKDCRITSWSNGREQGLCITYWFSPIAINHSKKVVFVDNHSKKVVFARCRISDSILVVYGTTSDFDHQTNQPSEEVYQKNRIYFNCGDYIGAAKFIKSILK